MEERYNFKEIEKKWNLVWKEIIVTVFKTTFRQAQDMKHAVQSMPNKMQLFRQGLKDARTLQCTFTGTISFVFCAKGLYCKHKLKTLFF